jgi:hypothetical protein
MNVKEQFPAGPVALRVLLINEDGGITAQMLEMDFAARGRNEEEALHCLGRTLVGQVRLNQRYGRSAFEGVHPAPERFWRIWRAIELRGEELPPETPEPHIIEATLEKSYRLTW